MGRLKSSSIIHGVANKVSKQAALQAATSFAIEMLESRQLMSGGTIAGTVFNDANGNRSRDAGEAVVAGQQVYLDLQGIDSLVAGDPTATTNANGAYTFTNLSAGNYLVRPVPQTGKVITSPVWGGKYFVQLAASQTVNGDDFGIQTAGSPNFTVSGKLLVAGTANGQATLSSYQSDGSVNVQFGTLGVVTLPNTVTGQPTGAAAQGNGNLVVNYPNQTVTLSAVGAVVSITTNGGLTLNAPTGLTAVATSATSVLVSFTDNATNEQSYTIERSASASGPWTAVLSIGGTAGTGSEASADNTVVAATTYFYRVYAVSGAVQSTIAGPVSVTTPGTVVTSGATLTGTVFNDANGNRLRDAGENGVAGQQVYLDLQGLDALVAGDPVATTDANGIYTFTNLSAGNYLVRPVPQSGHVITSPIWGGKYFIQLATNQTVTGNDFGIQTVTGSSFVVGAQIYVAGSTTGQDTLTAYNSEGSLNLSVGTSGIVTLPNIVTGQPTSAAGQPNGTIVFTYPTQIVTINGSGGIVSIVPNGGGVTLNAPTGLTATATAPNSINLSFTDNATNEQSYTIERSTSAGGPWISVGTIPGTAGIGTEGFGDNTVAASTTYFYRVYAVSGAVQSAIAGPVSVTTPNPVQVSGATISGMVFNDANGNGIQDTGEAAVAGRQVYLDLNGIGVFATGDPIATTDAAGHYGFGGLSAGNYLVRLVPQAGKVVSAPLFGGKFFIQLAANQTVSGDNFGTESAGPVNVTLTNGQLLVAGMKSGAAPQSTTVARFNADGSIDVTIGTLGLVTLANVVGQPRAISGSPNGNIVLTYSNDTVTLTSTGGTDPTRALAAPTGLIATALSGSDVQLQFNDNATNPHTFIIQRSTDNGATWTTVGTPVGTGAIGAQTFQDTTVAVGTGYVYRVYAVHGAYVSGIAGPVSVATPGLFPPAGSAWVPYAQMLGQDVAANQFPTLNGSGIGIAIIDRGIDYNIPQLGANKIVYQYNFRDGNSNGLDDYGHGTGVAGNIAANGWTYNGQYDQGVAPGANLIDLKQESSAGIKQALDWVIANHTAYNIQVVNITDFITDVLPGAWNPTLYLPELQTIYNLGIFISSPVGNGEALYGPNVPIDNPALSPYVTGVGGVDLTGQFYVDSKRGPGLDILAPASNVTMPYYSKNPNSVGYDQYDDNYDGTAVTTGYGSGTSWASSYVAGTAALLKQISPTFTPAQIQQIMQQSGTPVLDPTNNVYYSRLNIEAAIQLAYKMLAGTV